MSRIATIWNTDKINFLVENYAHMSNRKLAIAIGVSIPSVKLKARELGLKKQCAKRKIFPSLEADILRMSENYSYRDIANKLKISVSSVHCTINDAATKGFRKRSHEKTGKIMSEARIRLIKKERARVVFGLNQKTKIKLFPNKKKYKMRERMKRCRYEVEHNGMDVYIDDETRRHDNIETDAQRMGFNIHPPIITYYPLDFVTENGEAENEIFIEIRKKIVHV